MADRVYPTTAKDKIGSEREFVGIDVAKLPGLIKQAQSETDGKKLSAEALALFREKMASEEDETVREAGFPKGKEDLFQKNRFQKKDRSDDSASDDGKDDSEEDVRFGEDDKSSCKCEKGCKCSKSCCAATASARIRKIHFAHADQISAEALEAAEQAGDTLKVNVIKAARASRREAIAAKVVEASKEQMEKNQKLAKRHNYRMRIVAQAEEARAAVASTDGSDNVRTASTKKEDATEPFKTVAAATSEEKSAFRKLAARYNFPQEYVDAFLADRTAAALPEIAEEVGNILTSALPEKTKKAAVAGLVKTAELDDANVNRCIDYWVNDLGYGDAEWVRDLFTKKYD